MTNSIGYLSSKEAFNNKLNCLNLTCGCRISNFIWISHELKKVYIETPKCGCSSVKKALDITLTPEMALHAYVRKHHFFVTGLITNEPNIVPMGFGSRINIKECNRSYKKILRSLLADSQESDPVGKFGFSHYYGDLDSLIEKHPKYRFFCITRNSLKRFLSGVNMFYNENAFPGRRIQRLTHSRITKNENINDIVDDVLNYQNHHFNPISHFAYTKYKSKIQFIDLSNLNEFLKTEFNIDEVPHDNQAKFYKYKISDFSEESLLKIEEYYKPDDEIFSMVSSSLD